MTCIVEACVRPPKGRGLCNLHYQRWRMANGPVGLPTPIERFFSKVDVTVDGCWTWTGAISRNGYGNFYNGAYNGAHRHGYELLIGPIGEGLHLDHLCRNRLCVRPDHLEAVTPLENVRRGEAPTVVAGRRSTCLRGHLRTPENTAAHNGHRSCRDCRRELQAAS